MNFLNQQLIFDQPTRVDLPDTVPLMVPLSHELAPRELQYLVYIPWEEAYISYIPELYRDFFQYVKPYLGVRTTDVHTAMSVGFLRELIDESGLVVDERLVYIALILHDSGWSRVGDRAIADSLNTHKLTHPHQEQDKTSDDSHEAHGGRIAAEVLAEYTFDWTPTEEEKDYIAQLVAHHTHGDLYNEAREMVPEIQLVRDADHLWSYTHLNFWQDTVRKGQRPDVYAATIAASIDAYFVTDAAKAIARRLHREREAEVAEYFALKEA